MSHYLGVIHFPLPADFSPEQVHNNVRAKLDWEMEALAKAKVMSPDYYTFAGLVSLDKVGDSYAAYAHNPTSADSYDRFSRFAEWLGLGDGERIIVAQGKRYRVDAERLCGAVIDNVMPRPPFESDIVSADALIDSFGVNEWQAENFCAYVMNAVSARILALDECRTRAERLIRSETWRPRVAPDLSRPFIYAANGADIIGRPNGLTPADRVAHPTLRGRSILPSETGFSGHWLAFVDLHA